MPTVEMPITACPLCGGAVWDNRNNKKNPKGPDFKCKSCSEAFWLPKASAPKVATPAAQPVAASVGALEVTALYWECFDEVLRGLRERKLTDMVLSKDIAAMTATLFIARKPNGR